MKITQELFGHLSTGEEVWKFTIVNGKGEYVELLNYGATIHGIYVGDREGKLVNCVLQARDCMELEQGFSRAGSVIGRCANRIKEGCFVIDGQRVQLEKNRNGNFLHGASGNYAHKLFQADLDEQSQTVRFLLKDIGEGGFNNVVDVCVSYTFDDESRLRIHYELVPLEATILCPTNHAYFNLQGRGTVNEHVLTIFTDQIACVDETGIPNGGIQSVEGGPFDFTKGRTIDSAVSSDKGNSLKRTRGGYDHVYVMKACENQPQCAAVLCSMNTGIRMKVYTDMQGMILFTPANKEKTGSDHAFYDAVCLETQFVPNAVNCDSFIKPFFRAGERLISETTYAFDVIGN